MLGVAVAPCRSDKEKDLQGENFCPGGDNESLYSDLLACGGKGGRQMPRDGEFELELSLLLLLSVQPMDAARANELLEPAALFDIPPLLFLLMPLRFLSQKLLQASKFLRFLV